MRKKQLTMVASNEQVSEWVYSCTALSVSTEPWSLHNCHSHTNPLPYVYALKRYQTLRRHYTARTMSCQRAPSTEISSAAERESQCVYRLVDVSGCVAVQLREGPVIVMVECCVRRWLLGDN